ncbi:MAG TPA: hypothetical protein VEB64_18015 [Azospirillaceae bacterium]|nr:hypothetical protein [Azospirillaceae bacterium]
MFGKKKPGKAAPAAGPKALPTPAASGGKGGGGALAVSRVSAGDEPTIEDQIDQAMSNRETRNAANKIKSFADQSEQNIEALARAIKSMLRERRD